MLEEKEKSMLKSPTGKKNKNQKLRMLGKGYLGYTRKNGKFKHDQQRSERKMGLTCTSAKCRKSKNRFCDKFSENVRSKIFTEFWSSMNWDQRKIFVSTNVTQRETQRKTSVNDNSRRNFTLTYNLNNGLESLQVCRNMFLSTLDIKPFTVQSWVKKSTFGMHTEQSKVNETRRNNNIRVRQSVDSSMILERFFEMLPKLPSHYVRKDSAKLYLQEDVKSLSQLYEFFVADCQKRGDTPPGRKLFEKVFHRKNLSIFIPKKDLCDFCSEYKAGNKDETSWKQHIINKDRARSEKEQDKEKAKKGELILLLMDLQAVKTVPHLNASGLYFKTKLCCHNFTVYNATTQQASCYWFAETESSLCASTFTSCMIDYLEKHCVEPKIPVVIFSDGCTYQNRNSIMANSLLNFSIKHQIAITQKFLERGHTQMECDSVHSCIERRLKNREIYLPSDLYRASLEARKRPGPYEVYLLDYTFFKNYSLADHQRYSTIRPGRRPQDPTVTDLRVLEYCPETAEIKFKLSFDEELQTLPVRSKPIAIIENYPPLSENRLPIPATKWKHLQQLKSVLPSDCHHFYDNLPKKSE